ncbi:hypothetical protein ACOSP7_000128 [Xanthoceras sorbifolium]
MDLIHKLLNIVLPLLTLILLCFLLPPYFLLKFLNFIKRSIFKENVSGKVVLITGASSGIGEYVACEYAKRGACLALVSRRESRLQAVAAKARQLGSPGVIVIPSDVSKVEDCKRFIDQTQNHFGRLDHLVNNAGIVQVGKFEDCTQISDSHPVTATKAALISLYDTLRIEFGSDIGITIVTPGLVDSEITQRPEFLPETSSEFVPVLSTGVCAKAIVDGTCRGDRYVTEPSWVNVLFVFKLLCPEVLDWCIRISSRHSTSKKSA